MKNPTHFKSLLPFLIFTLIFLLEIWKIGQPSVLEWDEARFGINAVEMLKKGDFVNYYYLNEPDTWTAKPPLTGWAIALNYQIFGFNEFALRFHSVIAILLFFWFAYRLIRLYKSQNFALFAILLLATVNGIIGFHVGRTGDADSLLLLFLTASTFYFLKYLDFEDKTAIFKAGIMLGLAFYAKGAACLFLLPGLFLYVLIRENRFLGKFRRQNSSSDGKSLDDTNCFSSSDFPSLDEFSQTAKITKEPKKLIPIILDWRFWVSAGIWISFVLSWFLTIQFFGNQYENSAYGSDDAWTTMIYFDVIKRFSENIAEGEYDPFHVFHVLDINFNLWNYLFYLALIFFGFRFFKNKKPFFEKLRNPSHRLLILSFCLSFSLFILMTLSYNKHQWYLAPVLLFVAIILTDFLFIIQKGQRWIPVVLGLIFLFKIGQKFYENHTTDNKVGLFFEKHKSLLNNADQILTNDRVNQNYLLYLEWSNERVLFGNDSIKGTQNTVYFLPKKVVEKKKLKIVECIHDFCIACKI